MRLFVFVGLLFRFTAIPVFAQIDSVVLDSTFVDTRGVLRTPFSDSLVSPDATNLGEVLAENSTVFIKPSSGAGLSTLSVRGGNAEQSAVYWNGLNLQNTLNGTIDMSLLPGFVFDQVEVNTVNSSNIGSGAVSGSILLGNNDIDTTIPLQIRAGGGSFGMYEASGLVRRSSPKSSGQAAFFTSGAHNNYPYPLLGSKTGETTRLEHARYSLYGAILHHQQRFEKSNPLNIRLWLQSSYREIPATQLEPPSLKFQDDQSIRLQSDWSKQFKKNTFKVNVGSFSEVLDYRDSVSKIYSHYVFHNQSVITQLVHRLNKKIRIGGNLEFRNYYGDADTFYKKQRTEFTQAVHGRYRSTRTTVQTSIRVVQYPGTGETPVLYSIRVNRQIFSALQLIGSISKNYRMPTFNNLYWNPGGNPNLLSEESLNSEIGLLYNRQKLKVGFTIFSNLITNQIRWLPGASGYFEATQSEGEVQWNRGGELQLIWYVKGVRCFANATYVNSTNKTAGMFFGGNQQTYIPHFQGNSGLRYTVKDWRFSYHNWFVSERYLDTKNTESLPFVMVHNASVQRSLNRLTLIATIRNMSNLYYTIQPYRPNPPGNVKITVLYHIKKKTKQ